MIEQKKYIIKEARKDDGSICFFLFGLVLHVDDPFLVPHFIKETLQPTEFDYSYDWFDTYEKGFFVKENTRVEIEWSIYTDYTFIIDQYSDQPTIDKVKNWVTDIFAFLLKQEKVEITEINVSSFEQEKVIPLNQPQNKNTHERNRS